MKLLALGATGPTGRHVVDSALRRGDEVTVLARRPETVHAPDRVEIVPGDATSPGDLAKAMATQEAVVSALGRGKSIRADNLFTDAASAMADAAAATGVLRLVWLSSFGVGNTYDSANPVQKVMYRTFLRNVYANKAAAETTIRASDLEWTFVYPTALTNGPATGSYRVGDDLDMKIGTRISRADVADFMVNAAHEREWIGRCAVITN